MNVSLPIGTVGRLVTLLPDGHFRVLRLRESLYVLHYNSHTGVFSFSLSNFPPTCTDLVILNPVSLPYSL